MRVLANVRTRDQCFLRLRVSANEGDAAPGAKERSALSQQRECGDVVSKLKFTVCYVQIFVSNPPQNKLGAKVKIPLLIHKFDCSLVVKCLIDAVFGLEIFNKPI